MDRQIPPDSEDLSDEFKTLVYNHGSIDVDSNLKLYSVLLHSLYQRVKEIQRTNSKGIILFNVYLELIEFFFQ